MKKTVSIIIPVYNLEKYIVNCLESIFAQTYESLEIICIDDGSNDKSAEIIKRFAASDSRVKYFYHDNAGVSVARNHGLEIASGDYIMFVDGDDYLHYQAVELFVREIEKSDCDVVCAHEVYTSNTDEKMQPVSEYKTREITVEELFDNRKNRSMGKSVWGKIFKTEIARRSRFPVGISNGEDAYYIITLLDKGIAVRCIDAELYYYLNRQNSTVTSRFTMKRFTMTYSFDMLCERLKNSSNSFLKKYCLQYLFQSIFYNRTQAIGTECEKEVLSESKRIGKKWIKDFQRNKDISPIIKISFKVFLFSRHIYELARAIQNPTMIDFYKSRKKENIRNEA